MEWVVFAGNHLLAQVLPQIYLQNPEPVHEHLAELMAVMEDFEGTERVYLIQLFGAVAKKESRVNY